MVDHGLRKAFSVDLEGIPLLDTKVEVFDPFFRLIRKLVPWRFVFFVAFFFLFPRWRRAIVQLLVQQPEGNHAISILLRWLGDSLNFFDPVLVHVQGFDEAQNSPCKSHRVWKEAAQNVVVRFTHIVRCVSAHEHMIHKGRAPQFWRMRPLPRGVEIFSKLWVVLVTVAEEPVQGTSEIFNCSRVGHVAEELHHNLPTWLMRRFSMKALVPPLDGL